MNSVGYDLDFTSVVFLMMIIIIISSSIIIVILIVIGMYLLDCVAILNIVAFLSIVHLFLLLAASPSSQQRRGLVLLSKIAQAIANSHDFDPLKVSICRHRSYDGRSRQATGVGVSFVH